MRKLQKYALGVLLAYFLVIVDFLDCTPLPGPPIFYRVTTFASECYLPPDSGACDTDEVREKKGKQYAKSAKQRTETRYYFDTITEDCYPFAFMQPHCSKNANNWATKATCYNSCRIAE